MNLAEALKALKDGKKIKRKSEPANLYYQLKDKSIICCGVRLDNIVLDFDDLIDDDWEIVQENILEEKEK